MYTLLCRFAVIPSVTSRKENMKKYTDTDEHTSFRHSNFFFERERGKNSTFTAIAGDTNAISHEPFTPINLWISTIQKWATTYHRRTVGITSRPNPLSSSKNERRKIASFFLRLRRSRGGEYGSISVFIISREIR